STATCLTLWNRLAPLDTKRNRVLPLLLTLFLAPLQLLLFLLSLSPSPLTPPARLYLRVTSSQALENHLPPNNCAGYSLLNAMRNDELSERLDSCRNNRSCNLSSRFPHLLLYE